MSPRPRRDRSQPTRRGGLAGILWRKRRLRLAEAAAHRYGLEEALSQSRRTAKMAVVHVDATDGSEDVAEAAISGDTVIGKVAAQDDVDFTGLVTDFIMPYSPHQLLQRQEAAL